VDRNAGGCTWMNDSKTPKAEGAQTIWKPTIRLGFGHEMPLASMTIIRRFCYEILRNGFNRILRSKMFGESPQSN